MKPELLRKRNLAKFSKHSLTIDEKEIKKFTLSIGIAEYQKNEGMEQFLHRADLIMYEAKKCEGNSVVLEPESDNMSVLNIEFSKKFIPSSTFRSRPSHEKPGLVSSILMSSETCGLAHIQFRGLLKKPL